MYKYLIKQCDVLDKVTLNEYREKRSIWLNHLLGDDPHTILKQIPQLLWDDTLFRTVNEARRLASENPKPDVAFNGAVMRLFDTGFVTKQTMAIRRLTERWPPRSGQRDPKHAVISLGRLLFEIHENLHLLTREVYVSHDGLPYDPAPLERAWLEKKAAEGPQPTDECLDNEGPNAWMISQSVHENFDKLSGIMPDRRTRTDTMKPLVVERLRERLDECEAICRYADKFIAHAADPGSRAVLRDQEMKITLAKLANCHKVIYRVAYYITGTLLGERSHGGVPVPQYRHLKNLDKRWVNPENLECLEKFWKDRTREIEGWSDGSIVDDPAFDSRTK
ncbi:MAG: hypothetical protein HY609_03100 [Deltaproteobacteria bacterium]|nr:hypothetical protein [Deltaproteobacteria bacterium]MBI4223896.1 hypothetical protein [Deltaproteobacteria bacterium]